ncbi:MAG: hypothetical protein DPW15_14145, partial [Chloroflexi bacterium]|nr:hypothetical protein [Chloroflexota bacterium]
SKEKEGKKKEKGKTEESDKPIPRLKRGKSRPKQKGKRKPPKKVAALKELHIPTFTMKLARRFNGSLIRSPRIPGRFGREPLKVVVTHAREAAR